MKSCRSLLLLGLALSACSQQNGDAGDLGSSPNDLSVPDTQNDLSATDGPVGAWTTLSLVAGGLGGNGNADDTGPAARFFGPSSLAIDSTGNAYLADTGNHTIRKLVLATGAVSTIAGSVNNPGSADGNGSSAQFKFPGGLALDGTGNLFIADTNNRTIRKVVLATGTVSTIAGSAGMSGSNDGTGSAARFDAVRGIAFDGAGNLYVADSGNYTIRKLVLATGVVTTIAGTAGMLGNVDGTGPAARFNTSYGVATDGAGNLYVADRGAHTVRKIVLATAAVSTIAGTAGMTGSTDGTGSAVRFSGPEGLSLDGTGNLYVSETFNSTIRKVVLVTGVVSTVAGTAGMPGGADGTGSGARFNQPSGMALDATGNVLVADSGNSTIRKLVPATGAVTTIAGAASTGGSVDGPGATARFGGVYGLAVDGAGNIYVAEGGYSTIRKVTQTTSVVSTIAGTAGMFGSADGVGGAAQFKVPQSVACDTSGNVYVADTLNNTVRKVVLATGAVSTIAGTAGMTGSNDGIGTAARFSNPLGLALDNQGNLFVADAGNATIRKIVLGTSVVSTIGGTAGMSGSADGVGTAARFGSIYGMAADSMGYLYVADTTNHTIRKVALATNVVSTIAGMAGLPGSTDGTGPTARFKSPYSVSPDSAGNLYVADSGNGTIRKIVLATGNVTTVIGSAGQAGVKLGSLPGRLNYPLSVAVSSAGAVFIGETGENSILVAR